MVKNIFVDIAYKSVTPQKCLKNISKIVKQLIIK